YSSGSFGGGGRKAPPPKKKEGKDGKDDAGWRDTHVQLRGPVAAALDDLIRQTWRDQRCDEGTALAPLEPSTDATPAAVGNDVVRIVSSSPDDETSRIYALLLSTISAAQRQVHLTMAYFAPGDEMVDALCAAARRGVDVQLVLPSRSDFAPVLHAGRSYYSRMLEAGIRVHELQGSVLHAKTGVIDGVLSTIGSSNLDFRSFEGNNEVNAVVLGEDFGDAMERLFRADLKASREITREAWSNRTVMQRVKEAAAALLERWW
ncbi:MAG: phospholipase D-like domain-containing protein, partial [Rubrivivax sp.]